MRPKTLDCFFKHNGSSTSASGQSKPGLTEDREHRSDAEKENVRKQAVDGDNTGDEREDSEGSEGSEEEARWEVSKLLDIDGDKVLVDWIDTSPNQEVYDPTWEPLKVMMEDIPDICKRDVPVLLRKKARSQKPSKLHKVFLNHGFSLPKSSPSKSKRDTPSKGSPKTIKRKEPETASSSPKASKKKKHHNKRALCSESEEEEEEEEVEDWEAVRLADLDEDSVLVEWRDPSGKKKHEPTWEPFAIMMEDIPDIVDRDLPQIIKDKVAVDEGFCLHPQIKKMGFSLKEALQEAQQSGKRRSPRKPPAKPQKSRKMSESPDTSGADDGSEFSCFSESSSDDSGEDEEVDEEESEEEEEEEEDYAQPARKSKKPASSGKVQGKDTQHKRTNVGVKELEAFFKEYPNHELNMYCPYCKQDVHAVGSQQPLFDHFRKCLKKENQRETATGTQFSCSLCNEVRCTTAITAQLAYPMFTQASRRTIRVSNHSFPALWFI